MIRLSGVSKSFDGGRTFAVREVDLHVPRGQTLVLLGSSGCGKTTTLKMINRLIEPTDGSIEVDGRDVRASDPIELRRAIGYVFQGVGLMPHMTVGQNVAMPLRLAGASRTDRRRRAGELLALVELPPDEYLDRYPHELSGGQRQRVGVARALANEPKVLLMDEPFGALDALTRDTLQRELNDLKARLDKTVVFVTHDIFEALIVGDRIAVMHEGRIEQVGDVSELANNPASEFVRELFHKPARQLEAFQEQTR